MRKSTLDAIKAELQKARDIAAKAEQEDRDLTDVETEAIEGHCKKAEEMQANGEKDVKAREKMASMADMAAKIGLDAPVAETEREIIEVVQGGSKKAAKSLGDKFVNSDGFKALVSQVPGGRFGEKARVQQTIPFHAKDLFTGADHDTSAGSLVRPDYRGLLDPFYQRPLTLRSLVSSGATTSDTIEFVRQTTVTNNAAVVPEATSSAAVGSGSPAVTAVQAGVKPESGFSFDKDSTTVKTIAHWIPATKRALADAPLIRSMIDMFLRYGLEEALEDELLSGDGTGEHFLGIINTPGIQTIAPGAGEDTFDVTRKARTRVQIGGRSAPSAYVMNPIDWEDIELRRDGNSQFYGGGPFNLTGPRLWGLPVVQSEALTPGTAYVADWRWAVLYDREQASIQVTDSHADFFIRNLVAILAEMRAAFAILRPSAFVRITL